MTVEVNVSHPLAGLLPAGAAEAYQRLLAGGQFVISEHPELASSAEMRSLVEAGFARERYIDEPTIVPVEPARAIENALFAAQRKLLDQQRLLVRARENMELLQRTYRISAEVGDPAASIQVLTDPAEIGGMSVDLCMSAKRDVANLETAHFRRPPDPRSAKVPPAEVVARGVRFRNIYARAVLDVPGSDEMVRRCTAGGWELRLLPDLPMKMVLIDESAALLPLDPTGIGGAALVRSPGIVAALRMYFEMLWHRATPLGPGGDGRLSPTQSTILRLMAGGLTDTAIGRQIGSSERTVRRHITAILETMNVDNRMTAVAVAVREGWID
jgi:DNA-binding CsgD family transcriptional regulator